MKKIYDIIGAPFGFAANIEGSGIAPRFIRENGLNSKIRQRINNWETNIVDKGDILINSQVEELVSNKDILKAVQLYCNSLKESVLTSIKSNHIPIIIGGDHSISIANIAAASAHLKSMLPEGKLGLIWVDAHADLNNREDGNIHGKSVAVALGHVYQQAMQSSNLGNTVKPQNIVYIGVRDMMPHENKIILDNNIELYGMDAIEEYGIIKVIEKVINKLEETTEGIFLSFDIDGCEGSIFRGCGTPEVGGLTAREAIEIAYRVGRSEKFIGADIVELSPEDDCNGVTSQLVIKLVDALWGFRM